MVGQQHGDTEAKMARGSQVNADGHRYLPWQRRVLDSRKAALVALNGLLSEEQRFGEGRVKLLDGRQRLLGQAAILVAIGCIVEILEVLDKRPVESIGG
jgi:hypothetical protein